MQTRASRSIHRSVTALACAVFAIAPLAAAQAPSPLVRASRAVVPVVVHDGARAAVANGIGVFLDIGKLAVPRALLAAGVDLGVVIGGREQRTTAVLAEDRQAGVAIVAVDLPDGAPPAFTVVQKPCGEKSRRT